MEIQASYLIVFEIDLCEHMQRVNWGEFCERIASQLQNLKSGKPWAFKLEHSVVR